jgi:hypothetical protein
MRFLNHLVLGALIAVAPVLVSSEALAVIEPEPCGSEDIPGDSDCEVLTGDDCGSMCDACDQTENCAESCSSECAGDPNEIGCITSCIPACALELAGSCNGGCSDEGSLFCNGKFIDVENIGVCVDYLCSLGMDLGECGGEPEDATDEPKNPPPSAKPQPVSAVPGYGDPYSAPKPDLPKCAASEGSSEMSKGALLAAFVGAGLFVARRRRR